MKLVLLVIAIFYASSVSAEIVDRSQNESAQVQHDSYAVITRAVFEGMESEAQRTVFDQFQRDLGEGLRICSGAEMLPQFHSVCGAFVVSIASRSYQGWSSHDRGYMAHQARLITAAAVYAEEVYAALSEELARSPASSISTARAQMARAFDRFTSKNSRRFSDIRADLHGSHVNLGLGGSEPAPVSAQVDEYMLGAGPQGVKLMKNGVVRFDASSGTVGGIRYTFSIDNSQSRKAQEESGDDASEADKNQKILDLMGG